MQVEKSIGVVSGAAVQLWIMEVDMFAHLITHITINSP